jgi:hypothetical protein
MRLTQPRHQINCRGTACTCNRNHTSRARHRQSWLPTPVAELDRLPSQLDEPGSVYLVTHGGFSAIKVGVRNLDSYRLQEHERYGWTLIEEWQFDDGAVPLRIESAVLDWWRGDLDASVPFTPSDLPQGGYTETASTTEASPEATRDYIARTVAPLSG